MMDLQLPIIDLHCHGGPYRAFHVPGGDGDGMIAEMDAFGVDAAVLSAHQSISADYRMGNRLSVSWARRHPGRLWVWVVVNPNYPDDVLSQLEWGFSTGVVKGVKIHPELNGDYPMDGPGYQAMWEYAAAHKVPVLFHTYFGGDRLEVIDRLAARYPGATLVVGHSAVDLGLDGAADLARRHDNVVLDITGPQGVPGVVERLVASVGSDRLAFGSDMPFIDLGTMLGPVLYADISQADREAILWKTSARILGLDRHDILINP